MIHIYSDKECKLKYIPELPEEPRKDLIYNGSMSMAGSWGYALKEYEEALQQAKDNAIVIANEWIKYYIPNIKAQYATHHEPQDELYTITDENRKEAIAFSDIVQLQPDAIYPIEYEVQVVNKTECKMEHRSLCYVGCDCATGKVAYIKPIQKSKATEAFEAICKRVGLEPKEVLEEKETQEDLWDIIRDRIIDSIGEVQCSYEFSKSFEDLSKQFIITRK